MKIRVSVQMRVSGVKKPTTTRQTKVKIESGGAYLEVISNVVPKIWARTNSAIVTVVGDSGVDCAK